MGPSPGPALEGFNIFLHRNMRLQNPRLRAEILDLCDAGATAADLVLLVRRRNKGLGVGGHVHDRPDRPSEGAGPVKPCYVRGAPVVAELWRLNRLGLDSALEIAKDAAAADASCRAMSLSRELGTAEKPLLAVRMTKEVEILWKVSLSVEEIVEEMNRRKEKWKGKPVTAVEVSAVLWVQGLMDNRQATKAAYGREFKGHTTAEGKKGMPRPKTVHFDDRIVYHQPIQ